MRLFPALRAISLAGAVICATGLPATADQLRELRSGPWTGGVFSSNGSQKFNTCIVSANYKSGIFLSIIVDRNYQWYLGFASPQWNLQTGQGLPVSMTFDSSIPWNGVAHAISPQAVSVAMAQNPALISAFRQSMKMMVAAAGQTFAFDLNGTSKAMIDLVDCVRTELAVEQGKPRAPAGTQPSYTAASPPAAAKPADPPPELKDDLELAATRIASNLLLQAKLPNAHILERTETPVGLRGRGVAWTSDIGAGAVELLPQGTAQGAQQIASQLIDADATVCKGDFFSGRSSELVDNTLVTRTFTGCKEAAGTQSVRYFILHKEEAGYNVYALTTSGAAGADSTRPAPLQDSACQAAAIKAAFSR